MKYAKVLLTNCDPLSLTSCLQRSLRAKTDLLTLMVFSDVVYFIINKPIFACFVDFSKAFDTVNRNALFYKMQKTGITGKIFELIKSMYSSTFYCIKKENYLTKPRINNVGLKQGESLSPTLFNIFLNDIGKELNTENTYPLKLGLHTLNNLLFADDLFMKQARVYKSV